MRKRRPGVSLFSNCGAGDRGFADAGFLFRIMAELEPERLAVASLNHPRARTVEGDLTETLHEPETGVLDAYRKVEGSTRPALLAACPPCQGMSSARSERGRENDVAASARDPRNLLVSVIADAVGELEPRLVVVENVPAFLRRQVKHPRSGKAISAARFLVDELSSSYEVFPLLADLADFGVPQRRRRSFLTFVHRDEPGLQVLGALGLSPYPRATHVDRRVTVGEALAELTVKRLSAVSEAAARDPSEPLHFVSVLPGEYYRMIAATPAGGSAWTNATCVDCGTQTPNDEAVRCVCGTLLPRPIVDEDGVPRLVKGFRRSSYRRMDADAPAPTITTASGRISSDNTLHFSQNRVLSPLECQHLQTFPRGFKWGDTLEKHGVMKLRAMIGEAVPPMFTRLHGRVLVRVLDGTVSHALAEDDARVGKARKALGIDR